MSSFLEKRKEMVNMSRFYKTADFNKGGGKKNADERRNTETKQT